jgi:hypothetical protein
MIEADRQIAWPAIRTHLIHLGKAEGNSSRDLHWIRINGEDILTIGKYFAKEV